MAATGDRAPPEITAFIVEPSFPGIALNEMKVIRALSPYEIVLDNCEAPAENVLGADGGFGVAQTCLVSARAYLTPPAASASRRKRSTWLAAG